MAAKLLINSQRNYTANKLSLVISNSIIQTNCIIRSSESVSGKDNMASQSGKERSESFYVEYTKGINGLDKIVLREVCGYSAEVYLYGGQVTSWKTECGEELLFVSKKTEFNPPKPIRGGIQLCFPEFTFEKHERYGFARNKLWSVDQNPQLPIDTTHKASIDLILIHSDQESWIFPHKYEFRLRVTLRSDGSLALISRIRNVNQHGKKPFSFSFAYNTHLCVSDVGEVRIEGFETHDYLDNLKDKERFTEQGDALTFEGEVDRVYLHTSNEIAIIDHEKKRTYELRKDGLPDAGVWNPWDKKAKAIQDLENKEYLQMVCIQPARIEKGITLKPGEEWKGELELSLVLSSYNSAQINPPKSPSPIASSSKVGTNRATSRSPLSASKGGMIGETSTSPVATSKGGMIGASFSSPPTASKGGINRVSFGSSVTSKGG